MLNTSSLDLTAGDESTN